MFWIAPLSKVGWDVESSAENVGPIDCFAWQSGLPWRPKGRPRLPWIHSQTLCPTHFWTKKRGFQRYTAVSHIRQFQLLRSFTLYKLPLLWAQDFTENEIKGSSNSVDFETMRIATLEKNALVKAHLFVRYRFFFAFKNRVYMYWGIRVVYSGVSKIVCLGQKWLLLKIL